MRMNAVSKFSGGGGVDLGMIAALFVRTDSPYKNRGIDCYDKSRDARSYTGDNAVIAHPPCRAWGVLSHMAKPEPGEKQLAIDALKIVRSNGGILEHPAGSKLWKEMQLPEPGMFHDEYYGYSILVNQYDFGHVASKPTKLYIVGCPLSMLPPIPKRRTSKPKKSITGQVPGTARCTQYEREYTPAPLIDWLLMTAENIEYLKTMKR